MSQIDRTSRTEIEGIDEDDRAWLQEQIKLYSTLLTYLREH